MICVPILGPTYDEVYSQLLQAQKCDVDLVEVRLDFLEKIDLSKLEKLFEKVSVPSLLTVGKLFQQKAFASEEKQEEFLSHLLALKPTFINVEGQVSQSLLERIKKRFSSSKTKWMLSFHDFSSSAFNRRSTSQVLKAMQEKEADILKIAQQADSIIDALQMLKLCLEWKRQDVPLLGITMGEEGQSTRILSRIVGSPFTFACLDHAQATAPGQLSLEEMRSTYHYHCHSAMTHVLGLIGFPVDKSLSHLTHNAVLRECQVDGVYLKFSTPPHLLQEFFQQVRQLKKEGMLFKGFSVTMPFKEAVIPFLDRVSDEVQQIGAANTIVFEGEALVGYNTDGKGALDAIEKRESVCGKQILILGAGGAARAIAYEALRRGANVRIVNRSEERSRKVARELSCDVGKMEDVSFFLKKESDILIQATSVGMSPNVASTPVDARFLMPKCLVMDVVYHPQETRLLKEAKEQGCPTVSGLEMFLNQAIEQFSLWFGGTLKKDTVEKTLKECVSRKGAKEREDFLRASRSFAPFF